MRDLEQWKTAADQLTAKGETGLKIRNSFIALLNFIHRENWQGACHGSSTVLFSLLAAQNIQADLFIGEVSIEEGVYCDHSWIEVSGEVYDAAISKTLVAGLYYPPVFRGIDLSTSQGTALQYGVSSGRGYDANAQWIRSTSVSEYMQAFPDHPQGLFGITKLIGKAANIYVSLERIRKHASEATWKERP